jgi:hypothetical protein
MENYGFAVFMSEYWGSTTGADVRKAYTNIASLLGEYLISLTPEQDLVEAGDSESEYYLAGFMPQDIYELIVRGVRNQGVRVKEANWGIPKSACESVSDYLAWWNKDYEARMARYALEDAQA